MKTLLSRLFLMAALVLPLTAVTTQAQDASQLQARMAERIPAIDALKLRKAVGENNRGFLEARGEVSAEEQQLVQAENTDRGRVYALLARQTGSTPDAVGRARAQRIAQAAAAGLLLQAEDGTWDEK